MRVCLPVIGALAFTACASITSAFTTSALAAEPEYQTIKMEINVAKPAKEVWSKVGGYCDISKWLNVDCKITSGNGGIGTVRVLASGRVTEILIGATDLSYGYTQPVKEGAWYNLYHGFLEAKPVTDKTSKLVYTLMYDIRTRPTKPRKTRTSRIGRCGSRARSQNMKKLAEGQ